MADDPISPSVIDRPKPRLRIRVRLVLVAVLAVVPLMLDRVRILESTRSERLDTAYAEAADIAKRSAAAQLEAINTTRAWLQVAARSYAALVRAGQPCAAFINDLATDVPWIKVVSVVGANNRIICSTRPEGVGLDVSDRPYIQSTRRSGGFVLTDYIVTRSNTLPRMIAAYPTLGKDESMNAVIIAPFDLEWVGRLAAMTKQRPGASVFLVDERGTVLSGLFGDEGLIGRSFGEHPLVRDILQRNEGTASGEGFDSVRRIYAFTSLPGTLGRVVVGFDEHEVLSRIDREIGIAYVHLLLLGLLALLAAWFGGERLIVRALARSGR
jgi:hypothetical protein